jgi:translocator protein
MQSACSGTRGALARLDAMKRARLLFLHLLIPVLAVIAGNALIFALGLDGGSLPPAKAAWIPPGPVVGAVWIGQFALIGLSRWFYLRDTRERGRLAWLPVALGLLALAFPIYTAGLSDPRTGAAGTLVTLALTVATQLALGRHSSAAAWALVPLAAWLSYVAAVYS